MAVNNAFNRALEQLAAEREVWLQMDYDRAMRAISEPPESPIEEAMLLALVNLSHLIPGIRFGRDECPSLWAHKPHLRAHIDCQREVGQYRADFLITVSNGEIEAGTIVLECDGHDFHERTKEQAARDRQRDRTLTNAGHVILRVTGSEIYRDLPQVLADVMQALFNLWGIGKK